jgi:FKBP-type peptidyl-prolyl cis-trans isomerase SlyD
MKVACNTVVSMRYKMQNSKGEVLENILDGSSVEYLHGSGNILPTLEAYIAGLKAGDTKKIFIKRMADFQEVDDDFSFEVVIDSVRQASDEEIKKGFPLETDQPEECGPGCIC